MRPVPKPRTQTVAWTEPVDDRVVAFCVRARARIGVRVYGAEGFFLVDRPVTRDHKQGAVDSLQDALDRRAKSGAPGSYLRPMGDGWRLPQVGWWRDGELIPLLEHP